MKFQYIKHPLIQAPSQPPKKHPESCTAIWSSNQRLLKKADLFQLQKYHINIYKHTHTISPICHVAWSMCLTRDAATLKAIKYAARERKIKPSCSSLASPTVLCSPANKTDWVVIATSKYQPLWRVRELEREYWATDSSSFYELIMFPSFKDTDQLFLLGGKKHNFYFQSQSLQLFSYCYPFGK